MLSLIKNYSTEAQSDSDEDRDLVVAVNEAHDPAQLARVVDMAHQRLSARAQRERRERGSHDARLRARLLSRHTR